MGKNIVICLDGTNNQPRATTNTNVVRLYRLLDLADPARQVAYYDPGVGTFSAPGALTPPARSAMDRVWRALGVRQRVVPEGALVHASVRRRLETDPAYGRRLPASVRYVDEGWRQPRPSPAGAR